MEILLVILWYLTGVGSGLFTIHSISKEITVADLIASLTVMGLGGVFAFFIGLPYMDFGDWTRKKIF